MLVMMMIKTHMLYDCYHLQNTFTYFLSLVTTEAKKASLYLRSLDASRINGDPVKDWDRMVSMVCLIILYLRACVPGCSVVFASLRPHGLQPTGLLSQWNFPGETPGAGCHFLLQGSSWPRDWIHIPCITGRFFTTEPLGKNLFFPYFVIKTMTPVSFSSFVNSSALGQSK